ncbi:glycoside hydrolase family 3 N-terminal domain-containing protein [Georgenia sp. MJ206]|uniref:glycoside hydrolase family 3 protein n=1 Tax=Georgenia wangjunii TaxID=3117730 RepID=UPI002F2679B5
MRTRSVLTTTALTALVAGAGVAGPAQALPQSAAPLAAPAPACEATAASTLEGMSLKHKIGQLVMSQPGRSEGEAPMPGEEVRAQLEEWGFGTWIIQNRGGAAANVARYTNQMQAWADEYGGVPLLIGADMENGVEQQVPDATGLAYPMGLGATREVEDSALAGAITGAEAAAIGINWNFMAVADVNTNPANPVIGVRSFGEDADLVAEHVAAYTAAQQAQDVLTSAKHFPGHGDTESDSHLGLPSVGFDRETLETVHLKPFQAAIDAGADSIMTAHIVVEAIDDELPATLSPAVLTGLLREEMGFDGLVITDGMGMQAISDRWGTGEAGVMAVQAGADVLLSGNTAEEAAQALHDAVLAGDVTEERIDESVLRILETKCDYGLFDDATVDPVAADEIVGSDDFVAEATRIGEDSITLLKNDGDVLPLDAGTNVHVAGPERADVLATDLAERGVDATSTQTPRRPEATEIAAAVEAAADADVVIATTYTFSTMPTEQQALVDGLLATGKPVVVVSLGIPYDLAGAAGADAAVATYALNVNAVSSTPVLEGLANVLVGDAAPGGRLPVTVGDVYAYGAGLSYPPDPEPTEEPTGEEPSPTPTEPAPGGTTPPADDDGATTPPAPGHPAPGGELPATGAPVAAGALGALVLLGAGLALMARRTRAQHQP